MERMRMKALFVLCFLVILKTSAQNSLDDLNVIFKHNFEKNTLGYYQYDEYIEDWQHPAWNNRQAETKIVTDALIDSKAIQFDFPLKSVGASQGGGQWWTPIETGDEVYVSYDILFMPGFKFQLGGKLPSVQGGTIKPGIVPTGYDGFSGGMMFHEDSEIGFYIYFPYQTTPYGQTIIWGHNYPKNDLAAAKAVIEYTSGSPVKCTPGTWHNITYRMVLNSIKLTGGGNLDGILEAYFDGKLVLQISHLLFRHTDNLNIDYLRMYTFFGGSGEKYGNPIPEWVRFDNVILYTYKEGLKGIPYGHTLSATDRNIIPWREFESTVSTPPVEMVNNAPVINTQQFTVQQSSFSNNLIGTINATDKDAGQHLRYSIISGNEKGIFSLNSQNGELTTVKNYVFEPDTISYKLGIKVTDDGLKPESSIATINIDMIGTPPVEMVNNAPVINTQRFTVQQSAFTNNLIGAIIATDKDTDQHLRYSIISGNEKGLFSLNSLNGELSTVKNYIFGPGTISYKLEIKVTDDGLEPESSIAIINIDLIGSSKTVYLDPNNSNDLLENGSIDHPFDSWQDITFKEGYTYLQKRGTSTQIEKLLISANNVTLGAYGEGEIPEITSQTNAYLICGFEKSYIKLQNLSLKAENAVSNVYFLGSTCDSIIIDHCVLTGKSSAIKMVSGKTLVSKYNIITSANEGIYSSATTNDIYYNIFKTCNTAVNINSNQSRANVYNNVFVDNGESLSITYAELTLFNNIFYMTSPGQKALILGAGKISSDHNIFYPEQEGYIKIAEVSYNNLRQLQQDIKIDLNSFNSDPQFIDIYNNFTLKASSPAINTGFDIKLAQDLNGIKLPVASVPDIGAYEYTGLLYDNKDNSTESLVMKLYPNPSSGKVNVLSEINLEQLDEDFDYDWSILKVLDIAGNTIFTKRIERTGLTVQDNIDLSGISNGLYFVVLQIANRVIKEKLIINNSGSLNF